MTKSGETWVVTGAARGIGFEYVKQLLAAGVNVVATVRSLGSPALQALQEEHGKRLTVVVMDVGDFASIKTAAAEASKAHPDGIDVLIANAGIATVSQDINTPDIQLDAKDFDEFFHVNVAGLFATIQAFYPLLKDKQGGRKTVLTMSSTMGVISEASAASRDLEKPLGLIDGIMLAYKASKTAVTQITAQLAQSLKSEGFTFVAMHPGLVSTNAGDGLINRAKAAVGEEAASQFHITPPVSVQKQLEYLATVTQKKDNGRFVGNTGKDLPW